MKRLILALMLLATPVLAVQPDEILDDPVLEARAREISKGLRCLVCRNENIDDSNADLARDLRLEVREQLTEGATNDEVTAFLVDKYGADHVMLGTDYPYDMGDDDPLEFIGSVPGLTQDQIDLISGGNAARLMGLTK